MVALLTSVRNSPCFGGLRRTKTCHWQLFARPSGFFGRQSRLFVLPAATGRRLAAAFSYFLSSTKSRAKNFVTFLWKVRPCRDGTLRVLFPPAAVLCCYRNNSLPLRGYYRRLCRLFLLPAATDRRLRQLFPVADATFPPLRGGAIAKDCIKAPP